MGWFDVSEYSSKQQVVAGKDEEAAKKDLRMLRIKQAVGTALVALQISGGATYFFDSHKEHREVGGAVAIGATVAGYTYGLIEIGADRLRREELKFKARNQKSQ